jgi:hypothetical protein
VIKIVENLISLNALSRFSSPLSSFKSSNSLYLNSPSFLNQFHKRKKTEIIPIPPDQIKNKMTD